MKITDDGTITPWGIKTDNGYKLKINNMAQQTLDEIRQLAESQWEGCHHCTEEDKEMWINGFVTGYLTHKNS